MGEDPGWPFTRRNIKGRPQCDLMAIRIIFSAFAFGVALFAMMTVLLVSTAQEKPDSQPLVTPLVILGISTLLLIASLKVRIPLDTSSDGSLSSTYRGRVIIRAALAEGATLLGLVGFLATAQWWMAPVVAVIGVVGFASAAPTAGAIARDQERLTSEGCTRSITAAMCKAPSSSPT